MFSTLLLLVWLFLLFLIFLGLLMPLWGLIFLLIVHWVLPLVGIIMLLLLWIQCSMIRSPSIWWALQWAWIDHALKLTWICRSLFIFLFGFMRNFTRRVKRNMQFFWSIKKVHYDNGLGKTFHKILVPSTPSFINELAISFYSLGCSLSWIVHMNRVHNPVVATTSTFQLCYGLLSFPWNVDQSYVNSRQQIPFISFTVMLMTWPSPSAHLKALMVSSSIIISLGVNKFMFSCSQNHSMESLRLSDFLWCWKSSPLSYFM